VEQLEVDEVRKALEERCLDAGGDDALVRSRLVTAIEERERQSAHARARERERAKEERETHSNFLLLHMRERMYVNAGYVHRDAVRWRANVHVFYFLEPWPVRHMRGRESASAASEAIPSGLEVEW